MAWFADYDTNQDQQGTPLYIDGVIYVSTARNVVHAYDARSGKQLWQYNPGISGERLRYNLGLVNRGIAAVERQDLHGHAGCPSRGHRCEDGQAGVGNRYGSAGARHGRHGRSLLHCDGAAHCQGQGVHRCRWRRIRRAWLPCCIRCGNRQGSVAVLDRARRSCQGFESAALEKAAKTWSGQWWKDGGGGTVWEAACL